MNITLQQLLQHDSASVYPNDMLHFSTALSNDIAQRAYNIRDRNFSNEDFVLQMRELYELGCHSIQPPSTFGDELVFHMSRGNKREGCSASIFFCIYAVSNRNFAAAGPAPTDALRVVYFNKQGKLMIRVEGDGRQYEVNECDLSVTIRDKRYQLIYRIVGIGYHQDNTTYQLLIRDAQVIDTSRITL